MLVPMLVDVPWWLLFWLVGLLMLFCCLVMPCCCFGYAHENPYVLSCHANYAMLLLNACL
jgi:hypothetical protein